MVTDRHTHTHTHTHTHKQTTVTLAHAPRVNNSPRRRLKNVDLLPSCRSRHITCTGHRAICLLTVPCCGSLIIMLLIIMSDKKIHIFSTSTASYNNYVINCTCLNLHGNKCFSCSTYFQLINASLTAKQVHVTL